MCFTEGKLCSVQLSVIFTLWCWCWCTCTVQLQVSDFLCRITAGWTACVRWTESTTQNTSPASYTVSYWVDNPNWISLKIKKSPDCAPWSSTFFCSVNIIWELMMWLILFLITTWNTHASQHFTQFLIFTQYFIIFTLLFFFPTFTYFQSIVPYFIHYFLIFSHHFVVLTQYFYALST